MKIYLIRHGTTEGNLEKRYVGSTDEPLTREGVAELKKNRRCYPVPELVITSPLLRCVETASLLFPGAETERCEGLRECDFGKFEYKNYQELTGDPEYQAWIDSGGTLAFPGGESQKSFGDRSCRAFLESLKRMAEQNRQSVAYVVHGGTIMAVMERFCQEKRSYFEWQVKNGQGFAVTVDAERMICGTRLLKLTDCLPLPADRLPRSGIEDVYVVQKNKRLQCGYTTGSCAAAASKAAALMLLGRAVCRQAELTTPSGVSLSLEIEFPRLGERSASCAVRKFAGDDPDATDGLLVFAEVSEAFENGADGSRKRRTENQSDRKTEASDGTNAAREDCRTASEEYLESSRIPGENLVVIDGGRGVGRVTKPGLEQPVGAAAINRVPRQMITEGVREVCRRFGYTGGLRVTISIPGGEKVAGKTFNPRLGIEGGISVLGTSGIVVPMSEQALIESIRVEMRQKVKSGERYLLITPGNYGADFLKGQDQYRKLKPEYSMKCSNYVGETLDMAAELGVKGILFVAHIGKFVKVSGGIMNTHSAHADCRAELMAAQAMRAGADGGTVERLLASNTTEEAIEILAGTAYLQATIEETARRIRYHLQKRCMGAYETEVVLFSNQHGYLGQTEGAEELIEKVAEEKRRLYAGVEKTFT